MLDDKGIARRQDLDDGGDTTLTISVPTTAPAFDAGKYWSYLEHIEASDIEKAALLEVLWSLMASFVHLGFGIDPVQSVIPALIDAAERDDDGCADMASEHFNACAQEEGGRL